MRKRNIYSIISLWCVLFFCPTLHAERKGFAVVIDSISYQQAQHELAEYIRALESKQHFKVYTVVDRWGVPDSIRATLKGLHARPHEAIIGAVFIGDIPIPMIRDAQHLCSAFKMSQKMPWQESSVPSDRYYDDFSLHERAHVAGPERGFHAPSWRLRHTVPQCLAQTLNCGRSTRVLAALLPLLPEPCPAFRI